MSKLFVKLGYVKTKKHNCNQYAFENVWIGSDRNTQRVFGIAPQA